VLVVGLEEGRPRPVGREAAQQLRKNSLLDAKALEQGADPNVLDLAGMGPLYAAVVLNKVDFARNKYYYSRYYGHQYKNYYAEAAS
jgi:hypothetical protein